MDKEERIIALLEAHEHLSEGIGAQRSGMGVGSMKENGKLEGMKIAQSDVRNVIMDTALEEEENE